jgi:hypothetical protein
LHESLTTESTDEKSLQQYPAGENTRYPAAHVPLVQSLADEPVQLSHDATEGTMVKAALHDVHSPDADENEPGA